MKVIAINDAPYPESRYRDTNGSYLDRAYYKGDIFELSDITLTLGSLKATEWSWDSSYDFIIIHHDKIGGEMEVTKSNFMSLEDWRESKIDSILNLNE